MSHFWIFFELWIPAVNVCVLKDVYICICMCMHMYVCIVEPVCVCEDVYVCMYVYVYVCMYVRIYAHAYMYYKHADTKNASIQHLHLPTSTRMNAHESNVPIWLEIFRFDVVCIMEFSS